ncbi:MAG: hypothetical protein II725_04740, partial [Firmicutes bacterium]|nr:hypothetical protein [Bacillota bacterium]
YHSAFVSVFSLFRHYKKTAIAAFRDLQFQRLGIKDLPACPRAQQVFQKPLAKQQTRLFTKSRLASPLGTSRAGTALEKARREAAETADETLMRPTGSGQNN